MRDGWSKKIEYVRHVSGTYASCKLVVFASDTGGWDFSATFAEAPMSMGALPYSRRGGGHAKTFNAALEEAEALADEMLAGCVGYKKGK